MRLTSPRWATSIKEVADKTQRRALIDSLLHLTGHDRRRTDVINPDLCDEALDLLRPSLPPPTTCDIIDINPGAGIWSQKLHQILKPRRHVFVDTEWGNYQEILTPLLQQTNSAYRIAPSIIDALDEKNDFLSAELRNSLPSLNAHSGGSQAIRRSPTSQLIITANLAQRRVRQNNYEGEMCKLFFEHYYRTTIMDTGAFPWHKYGLVKLLAWVPEADKHSINPRGIAFRYRAARQLEASCQIREIVSSFPDDGCVSARQPWQGAALQSMDEVAALQATNNIKIPTYRQQPAPEPPSISIPPIESNFALLESLKDKPPLVSQYISAYKEVQASDPAWLEGTMGKIDSGNKPRNRGIRVGDPRRVFVGLRNRIRTTHNRFIKVNDMARAQIELEKQLIICRQQYPDQPDRYLELLEQLRPEFEALKERRMGFFKDNRHAVKKAIDDYRALLHVPHQLHWNNRAHEPLLCHPKKDFYPHRPLTLFEVTPRSDFAERIDTGDRLIIYDYISHLLEFGRSRTVQDFLLYVVGSQEAFDKFVGGFGDPNGIPSLTDPLYGGFHDLNDVRARSLGPDQIMDISLRYEKWPWRMSTNDMLAVTSGFKDGRPII